MFFKEHSGSREERSNKVYIFRIPGRVYSAMFVLLILPVCLSVCQLCLFVCVNRCQHDTLHFARRLLYTIRLLMKTILNERTAHILFIHLFSKLDYKQKEAEQFDAVYTNVSINWPKGIFLSNAAFVTCFISLRCDWPAVALQFFYNYNMNKTFRLCAANYSTFAGLTECVGVREIGRERERERDFSNRKVKLILYLYLSRATAVTVVGPAADRCQAADNGTFTKLFVFK